MLRTRLRLLTPRQRKVFTAAFLFTSLMTGNAIYLALASHGLGVGRDPEILPFTYQIMLVAHLVGGLVAFAVVIAFIGVHMPRMIRSRRRFTRTSGFSLAGVWLVLLLSGLFILSEANSRENMWIFVAHQIGALALVGVYVSHRWLSRDPPTRASTIRTTLWLAGGIFLVWLMHVTETGRLPTEGPAAGAAVAKLTGAQSAHVPLVRTGQTAFAAAGVPTTTNATGGRTATTSPVPTRLTSAAPQAGQVHVPSGLPRALDEAFPWSESAFRAPGDPDLESTFYPAKTTTTTGGYLPTRILTHDDLPNLEKFTAETRAKGFAPNYYLGAQSCERCHADIAAQWATSAHRFASFNNPFYRKSVELTREKAGNKRSKFCGGCHDPAIMLAGNMEKAIDPLTPESQAGLTCLACHAIDRIHDKTGNGNYNIHDQTESPYMFDLAKGGIARQVHDYLLKAKPSVHKQRMLKPVFRESEFCLSCHKVNLDVQVNDYRWIRGQNDYDAWHNSGFAHNNPTTWYEPPVTMTCQECHMAPEPAVRGDVSAEDGKVASHRFLGVNTALPHIRGDQDTIDRIETFLKDGKLRVDVFAIHREDGTTVLAPEQKMPVLKPGEIVQVDVVVRNVGVGHTFPGGTNDSNEGWIDFTAKVGDGLVYQSGALRADKHVDPSSHFFQAVIVDRHGGRIVMRNALDIYTTVYANVIRPSTSDIARYRFRVPQDAEGKRIVLRADLKWRKFNRPFTEFVFEGKEVPDLPITVIAHSDITLPVSIASQSKTMPTDKPEDWKRYNDYGVGLFLDEDTRGALEMFERVAELQPKQFDGWLNQARAYIADGSLQKAEEMLRKASAATPNQPRVAFFWGQLLERSGRLNEAVEAYRATLQKYPKSRDTWGRLGRTYWLMGRVQDSVDAYLQVLDIDPEHAQSYYQLSLAYKVLAGNEKNEDHRRKLAHAAAETRKAFEKYKIDENAPRVTQTFRDSHPYENRMSQSIVVHAQEGL